MVTSKTKFISNRGAFSHFSKSRSSAPPQFTERWINNFLKINSWNWRGSHLFCYWAWSQKKSAKLQNTLACTDKTGSSDPVWNLFNSSKSRNERLIKGVWRCRRVASSFPNYLGKIEATLLVGYHTCHRGRH